MSLEDVTTIANLKSWTSGVEVEWEAIQQLRNLAALPILAGHVAVMPDVHMGKGATVGSVIPTRAAIIPAAVGVDIGCGMCALRTDLKAEDLPTSLAKLRSEIESVVPVGFTAHETGASRLGNSPSAAKVRALSARYDSLRILELIGKHDHTRTFRQLGTLGGGNHFIELSLDESGSVWIMLHSGSRNIGKTIGETAITVARNLAVTLDRQLVDKDLAWLDQGTDAFDIYIEGLRWAQDYAAINRDVMMQSVLKIMNETFAKKGSSIAILDKAVNCHHNYANVEEHFGEQIWVTRKGAVSARAGELGIIPGSMGTKSYIVRGKGNADAYCSCSHGAGRKMSRGAAKRNFTLEDFKEQTSGVECRKDASVLDEIPGAYKNVEAVMAAQSDLVEIAHTLKQVMCIKG
jgi:tRNA-splicing ligase RtcB